MKMLQYAVGNAKGGLTQYILQNCQYINRNKFQNGLISFEKNLDFKEEYLKLKIDIFTLSNPLKIIKYMKELKQIKKNDYNIMHIHLSYNKFLILLEAKLLGFTVILHSHSTGIERNGILYDIVKISSHYIGKLITPLLVDKYLACSHLAAKWMFPKHIIKSQNYVIAKNAINIDTFIYNQIKQKQTRENLKISNNCVGRFSYPKNHIFLVKIFSEIVKKNEDSKLLFIGGYTNKDKHIFDNIQNLVKTLNLENKIIFLGKRNDVFDLFQAMDCFVLPSLFEGLPIVGIEAQTSGLPTFFSDKITKEVGVSHLANFISLEKEPKFWAEEILKCKNQKRFSPIEEIRTAGYDIKEEIKNMEDFYIDCINNKEENINGN